jgi:hypothetical protein
MVKQILNLYLGYWGNFSSRIVMTGYKIIKSKYRVNSRVFYPSASHSRACIVNYKFNGKFTT